MFLFFAFSATQVANASGSNIATQNESLSQAPNAPVLLYIALAFGFSLAVNAWVFFRISGGLFNPAVSESVASSPLLTGAASGHARNVLDRGNHVLTRRGHFYGPTSRSHDFGRRGSGALSRPSQCSDGAWS
jgi:hypothetical protein